MSIMGPRGQMSAIPVHPELSSQAIAAIDSFLSGEKEYSVRDLFGENRAVSMIKRFMAKMVSEGAVFSRGVGLQRRYYSKRSEASLLRIKALLLESDPVTREKGFGHRFEMSSELRNLLDGVILGDGHYSKLIPGNLSCCFQVSQRADRVDWLHEIKSVLDKNQIQSKLTLMGPKENFIRKTGWLAIGAPSYQLRTSCYWTFKEERLRWYPNGIKIVPKDLDLSDPTLLAQWYIGDGTISREGISIATCCFSEEDNSWITEQLGSELSIKANVGYSGGYPYIIMKMAHAERFLDIVRPHLPPSFSYKGVKVWEPVNCVKCGSAIENRTGHAKFCDQCCSPRESKERFLRNFEDPVRYGMGEGAAS